jgi:hypothetical protein
MIVSNTKQNMKKDIGLNGIERVAIACSMGSTDAISKLKQEITPGTYEGSTMLKIDFTVTKLPSYETPPTVDLLSKAILCRALVIAGFQRDNFYAALTQAALEAYATEKNVSEQVQESDKRVADEIAALTQQVISKLPMAKRSGKTTVKAEIKVLQAIETTAGETVAVDGGKVVGA